MWLTICPGLLTGGRLRRFSPFQVSLLTAVMSSPPKTVNSGINSSAVTTRYSFFTLRVFLLFGLTERAIVECLYILACGSYPEVGQGKWVIVVGFGAEDGSLGLV